MKRIAFQIARGENYDIGVVRLSDRRLTDFARSAAYDGMYTWSPDGMHVAFISGRDGFDGVYTADADGPSVTPPWPRPHERRGNSTSPPFWLAPANRRPRLHSAE